MAGQNIGRRGFLQGAEARSVDRCRNPPFRMPITKIAVPNSSGTEPAKLKAPPLACDCHHHIYDTARFKPIQHAEPNSSVADYRLLQRRIGTTRDVIVTPSAYGTDNRVTLDAISQLAPNAKGVAVIHPTITDGELKSLDQGGIRGIRSP